MIDLHSHILPGLDDGATDLEESLEMARLAAVDGVRAVICTPHWVAGLYENRRARVLAALEKLKKRLREENIALALFPGLEIRLEARLPRLLESGELLTLNDTGRFALIELPDLVLPDQLDRIFWDLRKQETTPIISHPERVPFLMPAPELLYRWVAAGALVQITSVSLLGGFGRAVREFAELLLRHNLVHFIATDAHGLKLRSPKLREGYEAAAAIVGEREAHKMVCENPRKILRGEEIDPEEPIPLEKRKSFWGKWRKRLSGFR